MSIEHLVKWILVVAAPILPQEFRSFFVAVTGFVSRSEKGEGMILLEDRTMDDLF